MKKERPDASKCTPRTAAPSRPVDKSVGPRDGKGVPKSVGPLDGKGVQKVRVIARVAVDVDSDAEYCNTLAQDAMSKLWPKDREW